jgi:hypothetical protein
MWLRVRAYPPISADSRVWASLFAMLAELAVLLASAHGMRA